MSDDSYTPPDVWKWEAESGGRFASINRPVAGPTHDKALPVGEHPFQLYSLATPNGVKVTVMFEELLARHGAPEIFNTDQGGQFTSPRFTDVLQDAGVRISMDGKGRWMDNVFIGRLWRSLKYECIYLHAFETGSELRAGLRGWIDYYNVHRPHSALGGSTPDEAYAASDGYQATA